MVIPHTLLPASQPIPAIVGTVVAETGEFEQGDGMRVTATPTHLAVEVKVFERECQMLIPFERVLDGIAIMTRRHGS